jgi:hypothetical protein
MAIAFDQDLGSNNSGGGSSNTVTLTTSATASAGTRIVVWASAYAITNTVDSCSGGGLTWVRDLNVSPGSNNPQGAFFSADAPAGLPSGTVLTVTYSGSSPPHASALTPARA